MGKDMGKRRGESTQDQISAWGYFGLDLLYAVPIIGLIFMIIHARDDSRVARRNYARSRFIPFLIWGVLVILALVLVLGVMISRGGTL